MSSNQQRRVRPKVPTSQKDRRKIEYMRLAKQIQRLQEDLDDNIFDTAQQDTRRLAERRARAQSIRRDHPQQVAQWDRLLAAGKRRKQVRIQRQRNEFDEQILRPRQAARLAWRAREARRIRDEIERMNAHAAAIDRMERRTYQRRAHPQETYQTQPKQRKVQKQQKQQKRQIRPTLPSKRKQSGK